MLTLHNDSHLDHVPPAVLGYVTGLFHGRTGPFIETVTLPAFLPDLECRLYGPSVGDGYIPETAVVYEPRGDRPYASRLIAQPPRPTRLCTVVAVEHGGQSCVLATVYGGPAAPREPGSFPDDMPQAERDAALLFWARHALAK